MSLQTPENQIDTNPQLANWDATLPAEEQRYRAGAYNLLASVMRDIPSVAVLDQIRQFANIATQQDEIVVAMTMLGLAAHRSNVEQLEDEFHALFIGLGRGELVPYGSWYLTGFLMEKPLALLRDDLDTLGYERQADVHEPEDHVAALCEVMAMLIADNSTLNTQQQFFENHIAPWMGHFFLDLTQAKHAVFYRSVGRFGLAFIDLEKQYLDMKA